jgi:mRNA-degrading endonuclease RelE of RelBE toxin-antitoxin system
VAELRLTRRARTDLEKLSPQLQDAVLATLDALALDPRLGKPLVGRLRGLRSARVGSYRVLYTIEGPLVVVRAIRHRGVAYRP